MPSMASQRSEHEPGPESPVLARKRRSVVTRGIALVAWVMAIALPMSLLAARLVGWIGSESVVLAFLALMIQVFAFHVGLVAAAMVLVALGLRRWRLGLVLLASVLVTVGPSWLRTAQRTSVPAVDDDQTLTVLSCNLRYGTAEADPLLAWIEEIDPDVIVFQEYADPWTGIVARELRERYPHVWQEPGGAHGQATLSRMPLVEVVPDIWERAWKVPSPRVAIEHEGKRVDITNVHVYPPIRFSLLQAQMDQIQLVAEDAYERLGMVSETPMADGVLYLGDFNAPWNSNHLRPLARVGLREAHARVGTDRGASWGPPDGLLSIAPGIRIDHALYGGGLQPVWSVVGPDVGSDHRPIAVGFVLN